MCAKWPITFDQPLYWKAIEIQKHNKKDSSVDDIVLILGSFHSLMSYLGSIGHLMSGTGLQPVLEQVYAENTVPHMLSGKAVSRARRRHLLVACALEGLKVSEMYEINILPSDEDEDEDGIALDECPASNELLQLVTPVEKTLTKEIGFEQLSNEKTFKGLLERQEIFIQKHNDS